MTVRLNLPPFRQSSAPSVNSVAPENLFDAQKLIVLGEPITAAERTGFDLTAIRCHRDVRDRRVLSFSRAMAEHRSITILLGQFDRVERLRERADLVYFDQNRIRRAGVDALLQEFY